MLALVAVAAVQIAAASGLLPDTPAANVAYLAALTVALIAAVYAGDPRARFWGDVRLRIAYVAVTLVAGTGVGLAATLAPVDPPTAVGVLLALVGGWLTANVAAGAVDGYRDARAAARRGHRTPWLETPGSDPGDGPLTLNPRSATTTIVVYNIPASSPPPALTIRRAGQDGSAAVTLDRPRRVELGDLEQGPAASYTWQVQPLAQAVAEDPDADWRYAITLPSGVTLASGPVLYAGAVDAEWIRQNTTGTRDLFAAATAARQADQPGITDPGFRPPGDRREPETTTHGSQETREGSPEAQEARLRAIARATLVEHRLVSLMVQADGLAVDVWRDDDGQPVVRARKLG